MKENKTNFNTFDILWMTFLFASMFILNMIILIMDKDTLLWIKILILIASISGVFGTYLATLKDNRNWYFGITHIILYGIVALHEFIYGDFILNIIIYLPMNIYGYFVWRKNIALSKEDNNEKKSSSKKLSNTNRILIFIGSVIAISIFGYLLSLTKDPVPWLDSTSTILSIVGMVLMMLFFLEQWAVWFIVNIVSALIWVGAFIIYGNLSYIIFIIMWSIYLINSIIGFIRWLRQ